MLDDTYLIKKIKGGNYAAFNLLISRYQSYVYAILNKILKNKEEAEEAFQDTFLKVYKSLDQFQEGSKFSSWLYRIAYNTGLDYYRKLKPTTELIDNKAAYVETNLNSDPLEQVELSSRIDGYLNRLPEEEKRIIRLFYLMEMSVKELCVIMEMTETNVKTKLFRARKKLQNWISESEKNELKAYYHG